MLCAGTVLSVLNILNHLRLPKSYKVSKIIAPFFLNKKTEVERSRLYTQHFAQNLCLAHCRHPGSGGCIVKLVLIPKLKHFQFCSGDAMSPPEQGKKKRLKRSFRILMRSTSSIKEKENLSLSLSPSSPSTSLLLIRYTHTHTQTHTPFKMPGYLGK